MTDDTHHGAITDAIEALEVNIIFTNTLREYFYESKDTVKALGAWHLYENNKKTLAKLQALKDAVPDRIAEMVRVSELDADKFNATCPDDYCDIQEVSTKLLHEAVGD